MKPKPPNTLDALKSLVGDIARGSAPIHLGGRALKTLAAMVAEPRHTAVYSIGTLADTHGVNASTLTRLAQRLGYDGFAALQEVFRHHVADQGHFYSERAGRLATETQTQDHATDRISGIPAQEIGNISAMTDELDPAAIEGAAEILVTARRVRTHGLHQSAAIAGFMAYALGMLHDDAAVLDSQQHGVAHGLAQLTVGDALVLVGFSPYTRGTVAAARVAAQHGITVIALTDSHASPLSASAAHSFVTPTGGAFFSNCMASAVVLVEVLLSSVARHLDQQAVTALKRYESFIEELNVQL